MKQVTFEIKQVVNGKAWKDIYEQFVVERMSEMIRPEHPDVRLRFLPHERYLLETKFVKPDNFKQESENLTEEDYRSILESFIPFNSYDFKEKITIDDWNELYVEEYDIDSFEKDSDTLEYIQTENLFKNIQIAENLQDDMNRDPKMVLAVLDGITRFLKNDWGGIPDDIRKENEDSLKESKGGTVGVYSSPKGAIALIKPAVNPVTITVFYLEETMWAIRNN